MALTNLSNKVAVVTGAASGIGLGTVRALVGEGVNVAMLDVEENALRAAVAEFDEANVAVKPWVVDVGDRDAMASTAASIVDDFGRLDIAFNNAGVAAGGPIDESSYADWDWVINVNLFGVVHGMKSFVPYIKQHGEGGHVVNTASILGHIASSNMAIYSATKFAVVGISEAAREDLAPFGIGVSALCPGMIATNIIDSDRNRQSKYGESNDIFTAGRDEMNHQFKTAGLNPDRVGEQVVHGIKTDKPFIFTHADLVTSIQERFDRILGSFDGSEATSAALPGDEAS